MRHLFPQSPSAHNGVKLIAFDFDGTLVDSRVLILECHRAVFIEFGLPLPLPEDGLAGS
jgi:phosphoglycolate phosphatase-like HAD superfamily hydrolase